MQTVSPSTLSLSLFSRVSCCNVSASHTSVRHERENVCPWEAHEAMLAKINHVQKESEAAIIALYFGMDLSPDTLTGKEACATLMIK